MTATITFYSSSLSLSLNFILYPPVNNSANKIIHTLLKCQARAPHIPTAAISFNTFNNIVKTNTVLFFIFIPP